MDQCYSQIPHRRRLIIPAVNARTQNGALTEVRAPFVKVVVYFQWLGRESNPRHADFQKESGANEKPEPIDL